MALSCSYIPTRDGIELKEFRTYKNELGYKMAADIFSQVLSPEFQEKYKSKIVMDAQGVPTYESVLNIPYVRKYIGISRLIQSEQKKFSFVPDNRENYRVQIQAALDYNKSSVMRDLLVAAVYPSEDGSSIRVELRERTPQNEAVFNNQYGTDVLNRRLSELFGDIGVTPDLLEKNEQSNGFVDFSKASNIADGFKGLINIADGMEGELALPEEFAHTLIGMFRDTPLVQRSLRQLENNDSLVREILGDEYDVNRAHYENNPNYDEDGNEMTLEQTLAEEALGKLLQEKLKDTQNQPTSTTPDSSTALGRLVDRILGFLKKVFKGRDADAVVKAKNDADASMGELARQILSGERSLEKERLAKAERKAVFHQLDEKTDKVIQLLQNADNIERKRVKISPKERQADIKRRIIQLEALINDKDRLIGMHTYAKWALSDLNDAMDKLTVNDTLEVYDFKDLRHIKSVIDSYGGFIDEMYAVLEDIGDLAVIDVDGQEVDLNSLWDEINRIYKSCSNAFKEQALTAFSDYLAPIYERSPLKDKNGKIRPLKDVLTGEDFDISEFDRWLTSAGNSSSVIVQMFDWAVKKAKGKAKEKTTSDVRKIWKLMDNAEKRGITSFEWMYEKDREGHKTGNYISKYNRGQYDKDLAEMEKELERKYGKHPLGENHVKASAERRAWYDSHADVPPLGNPEPNEMYLNRDYANLTKAQKETLDEILAYKASKESALPADKRNTLRAVQRRRNSSQRIIDAVRDPEQAYNSAKEAIKDSFNRNEDDDQIFGDRTSGLTDFTEKEYMTLPILYTNRLKNPDELSTDIFGDLMVYSYMTNTYEEISNTYDPLEIGVTVVTKKEFTKNSGSKLKEEVINTMGKVTRRSVKVGNNTLFERKLRDFLECQVYGRYLKDEGDLLGKDVQKTISTFQRLTSLAYLGCNWLAGVANVATAAGMQNIEMAAGEFFGAKELAKADFNYFTKLLPPFMAELTDRKKQSELALFDELFDVRQNFKDKLHNIQKKNFIQRFFGQNWMFIQQGMGDHWIYNRTALAMAMRKKVKVRGKEMSVWEARQIVKDENGYKRMIINPEAKNLDGSEFSALDFSREIAKINHTIAGIYNDEDQNAANRVVLGRMAQQMRKWIIPQFMRRFQSKRPNITLGMEEEGYYRTAWRLAKDIWKSGGKFITEWDKLSNEDKANARRAIAELLQTLSMFLLVNFLAAGSKDPDRHWALKFAEYMANRELHELGFLTPSPLMLTEGYKTVTSPFVMVSAANNAAQAVLTTANPFNWFPDDDELIQSGRYEGHSYIYKRWMELPLPPFTQVRQLEKFFDGLDEGTKYYSKDYK